MALNPDSHLALPTLVGAPAYARPRAMVAPAPRPFDPDDLPLEAERTDEERRLLARAWGQPSLPIDAASLGEVPSGSLGAAGSTASVLQPRPLSLRSIAERIRGGGGR